MQLLATEEYGLRCLLQVARHQADRPLTIPEISEAEGLSAEYTGKIMRALREGGMVTSTRGAAGGYRLARRPNEITAWEVIQSLGGGFYDDTFCETHPGQLRDCIHSNDCSIRALWQRVEGAVRSVLEGITLADLRSDEGVMAVWLDNPESRPGATSR